LLYDTVTALGTVVATDATNSTFASGSGVAVLVNVEHTVTAVGAIRATGESLMLAGWVTGLIGVCVHYLVAAVVAVHRTQIAIGLYLVRRIACLGRLDNAVAAVLQVTVLAAAVTALRHAHFFQEAVLGRSAIYRPDINRIECEAVGSRR